MKSTRVLSILVLLVLSLRSAEAITFEEFPDVELPDTFYQVTIRSRAVKVTWKDGRPMVLRADVAPIFNLGYSGEDPIDLIKLLHAKHYTITYDGFEAIKCSAPLPAPTSNSPGLTPTSSSMQPQEPRWVCVGESETQTGVTPTRIFLDTRSIQGNSSAMSFSSRFGDSETVEHVYVDRRRLEYSIRIAGDSSPDKPSPIPPGSLIEAVIKAAAQRLDSRQP